MIAHADGMSNIELFIAVVVDLFVWALFIAVAVVVARMVWRTFL